MSLSCAYSVSTRVLLRLRSLGSVACVLLGLLRAEAAQAKETALPPKYQSFVFAGKVETKFRYEVRALSAKGELLSSFPVYPEEGAVLSGDTLRVDGAVQLQTAAWLGDELLVLSEPIDFKPGAAVELKLPEGLGALTLVPASVSVSEAQVTEELRRYDFNVLDAEGRQLPFEPERVQWTLPFGPSDMVPVLLKPPLKCPNTACVFLPVPPKERSRPVLTACLGPLCAVTREPEPEPEPGPRGWKSVGAGLGFSCGLTFDGRVLCWGEQISSLLGQPPNGPCVLPPAAPRTATCARVPMPIVQPTGALTTFQALDVGESHACAVDTSGSLWCWGQLAFSEGSLCPGGAPECRVSPFRLNPSDPSVPNTPARLETVSAGAHHTCAVTVAGSLLCFGRNDRGEAGSGQTGVTFNAVGAAGSYASVSAGKDHSCALTTAGGVDCWGWTIALTRLSESTPPEFLFFGEPRGVLGEHPSIVDAVDGVSAGHGRTCIHAVDGTLSCLDERRTDPFRLQVEQIDPMTSELETSITDFESKCQVESGRLFCDLAQGSMLHTLLPFTNAVIDCSVERFHGCAVESDGTAWCWGDNASGQLGDGTIADAAPTQPVAVLPP